MATDPTPQPTIDETTSSSLPVRRIEFHLARKPASYSPNVNPNFKLETLNPSSSNNNSLTNRNRIITACSSSSNGKKIEPSDFFEDAILAFRMPLRRIGAGLENLGNTCFLNSVIQCLTYTEPLVAYLQSGKHQNTCRVSGFCALCAMQKHVSRALQASGRSLSPKDLVLNLRCISRTFRNARQEDAHEYMRHLLESMHKCCLPSGVPAESPGAYEKSLVHKIFGGRLRSQVQCLQCLYCSNTFDPFLDLSLEIVKADTLYKALRHFTDAEQLDGGEKQYKCDRCKQKVRARKQLTISKAPYILTVHLKRFRSMSGQKIDKKVQFGSTLDLKPFVTGDYEGDLTYTLYGVLVHAGWSTHSGHYYCYVRTSNGLWYSLDDNRVRPVSESTVMQQKAYMLFYVRDRKNIAPKKAIDIMQKENLITTMRNAANSCSAPGGSSFRKAGANESSKKDIPSSLIIPQSKCSDSSEAIGQSNLQKTAPLTDTPVKQELNLKLNLVKHEANQKQNDAIPSESAPKEESFVLQKHADDTLVRNSAKAVAGARPAADNEELNDCQSDSMLSANKPSSLEGPVSVAPGVSDIVSPTVNISEGSKSCESMTGGEKEVKPEVHSDSTNLQNTESGVCKDSRGSVLKIERQRVDRPSSIQSHVWKLRQVQMKNILKSRGVGMHLSTKMLYGASLSLRKRKKCKGLKHQSVSCENLSLEEPIPSDMGPSTSAGLSHSMASCTDSGKNVPNSSSSSSFNSRKRKKCERMKQHSQALSQENLIAEEPIPSHMGPSMSAGISHAVGATDSGKKAHEMSFDKGEKGASLKRGFSSSSAITPVDSDSEFMSKTCQTFPMKGEMPDRTTSASKDAHFDGVAGSEKQNSQLQNGSNNGITQVIEQSAGWEGIEPPSENGFAHVPEVIQIGYVGDEWDVEYDRGKKKKVRGPRHQFDGSNLFQEAATKKAKSKPKGAPRRSANKPFRI